ncbi:MAG: hypothetical protein SVT56_08260 [Chloroflexota bacterium]|nr:hypothetical protein [Chloroflexota bacterium]
MSKSDSSCNNPQSTVYVVHCIDTEGPLHESIDVTFNRLKEIFGLELEPNQDTLKQLQNAEVDLGGIEQAVQQVIHPDLLDYMDTWDKIDNMLDEAQSPDFRNQLLDSNGNGWIFNWFCLDHVGFTDNPRRRTMGYHSIYDHYRQRLSRSTGSKDAIHFHYHPHSFQHKAHHCATHWWINSSSLYQILSRRIIERLWFPSTNRPGFHVTRPDSHWFLEQFIPFDYASQSITLSSEDELQADLSGGRFGDWRRAPKTWRPYHPHHDDYQREGNCRRWIARCLNVGTRLRLLTESDVRCAFEEANKGIPVVLAFTNHDFRDIRRDVCYVRELLIKVSKDYPDVAFSFSEATRAMRKALKLPPVSPCDFELQFEGASERTIMRVKTKTPTFGPQPFLAIKTLSGEYLHDNFDIQTPNHEWSYTFDEQTLKINAIESIGIAANNSIGVTSVLRWDSGSNSIVRQEWNCSTE